MKRKFFPLTLLLAGVFMLASCLGDDTNESNITYYGDAAVTSFSLGTLKRYYLYNNGDTIKKTTDGKDSTTTVDCSGYKLMIDQLAFAKDESGNTISGVHPIENVDSLPAGTDISRVVCTANTKNSGVLTLLRLKKNETDKDTVDYYNSDSVDFTTPRIFRVYSNDGTTSRSYRVKLNVHKEQPDSFVWRKQSIRPLVEASATPTNAKLVPMGNTMFLAVANMSTTYLMATSIDGSTPWHILVSNMNMAFGAEACDNVAALDGWLYLYNGGKELFRAKDGATWESVSTNDVFSNVKRLVGAGNGKLYAVTTTGVISSEDGSTWTVASLNGDKGNLPSASVNVCTLPSKTNKDVERVLMIGDAQNSDSTAVVWGKLEDKSESADSYSWSVYENTYKYQLPNMKGLAVMVYDDALYAVGGEGINGSSVKAYEKLYRSTDQGLTWKTASLFTLPADFSKDANAETVCMAADAQNHVWFVNAATGDMWTMRINRLGWKK